MSVRDTTTSVETATANSKARDLNSQLLQSLIAAFMQNPQADLAVLLPSDYDSHVPPGPPPKMKGDSKLARHNRQTINVLLDKYATYPEGSLNGNIFPSKYSYERCKLDGTAKKAKKDKEIMPKAELRPAELPPDYFASMIDQVTATSYDIVAPLDAL